MARVSIESVSTDSRGEHAIAARVREMAKRVQQLPEEVVVSFALPDAKARASQLQRLASEIFVGLLPLVSWIERRRPPGTADLVTRRLVDATNEAVACVGSEIPEYAGGNISRPTGPPSPGAKRTARLVVMARLLAAQLCGWAGDIEVEEASRIGGNSQTRTVVVEVGTSLQGEPSDDSSWVGASTLWPEHFETWRKAKAFLKKHPEIRTRHPRENRCQIHAGDWAMYWAGQDKKGFDALDKKGEGLRSIADDPSVSGEFLAQAEERVARLRAEKRKTAGP